MSSFGGWGVPGSGTLIESTEREILWGGDRAKGLVLEGNANYSGAARDAGHTSYTTVLRAGLIMGQLTTGAELEEWDADAADGTEHIYGVVPYEIRTQDFNATDTDRVAGIILSAPVKASQLLIQGTALTSHVDEYLARRQLHTAGFRLDDDPQGYLAGVNPRYQNKATDYTVVGDDNGSIFFSHTADANFTLPTIAAGLEFTFIQTENFELAVTSAEGGNMIVGNDLSANSVTFTTTAEQIGAIVKVTGVYANGTLKWHVAIPQIPFGTDGAGLTYAIAT